VSSSAPYLIAAAIFVRDLLGLDEQTVRIGRQNFERTDFTAPLIVVDALQPSRRIGQTEDYDGSVGVESLALGTLYQGRITLDFYGADAYTRAEDYSIRSRSQAAYELKRNLGIDLQQPGQITNVGQLTGQQWGERYQLEQTITHSGEIVIDTLRIDEAQIEVWTEEGIQNG